MGIGEFSLWPSEAVRKELGSKEPPKQKLSAESLSLIRYHIVVGIREQKHKAQFHAKSVPFTCMARQMQWGRDLSLVILS